MNRREALLDSIRFAACTALSKAIPSLAGPQAISALTPLKTAAPCPERRIGVVVDKSLLQDPTVAEIVIRNFNLITASGMKWNQIHPGPATYDFAEGDWNVHFAQQNDMQVHGHNLCWNSPLAIPPWFKNTLNSSNAKQYLAEHINTVMKRYEGRVTSWDVVNEPLVPWSKRSDGLYPGIWVDLLGPTYIDDAFHAAAAADPKALRILNIYRVEQGTSDDERTRRDTIELLKQLLDRGVPVQAVGIESHLDASQPLGGGSFRQFLEDIRALRLQVLITELDVKENRAGSSLDWDESAAKYYAEYLTEFIPAVNPPSVIFFSIKDRWENGKRIQGLLQNSLTPRLTFKSSVEALAQHGACR
jgi:endo-1,4-beta-xylanase